MKTKYFREVIPFAITFLQRLSESYSCSSWLSAFKGGSVRGAYGIPAFCALHGAIHAAGCGSGVPSLVLLILAHHYAIQQVAS